MAAGPVNVEPVAGRSLKQALEAPERQIIREVLEANHWNRNATAEALGINRTTLYKKMKRLGLEDLAAGDGAVGHVAAKSSRCIRPRPARPGGAAGWIGLVGNDRESCGW